MKAKINIIGLRCLVAFFLLGAVCMERVQAQTISNIVLDIAPTIPSPCVTTIVLSLEVVPRTCSSPASLKVTKVHGFFPCISDILMFKFNDQVYSYIGGPQINSFTSLTIPSIPIGNHTFEVFYTRAAVGGGITRQATRVVPVINYCSGITVSCSANDENCIPGNDGRVNVTVSQAPAYPPYTVKLYKADTLKETKVINTASTTFYNLAQGTYSISASDSKGNVLVSNCTATVGLYNNTSALNLTGMSVPPFVCLNAPPINLNNAEPPGGIFSGPGVVSNVFTPQNAGVGEKTLTYNYSGVRPGCGGTATLKIEVLKAPPFINRVISATAMPLNDQWPADFSDASYSGKVAELNTTHPFNAGSKGIWKGEESYVYVEYRNQSNPTHTNPNVILRWDGVYDYLPLFLFNQPGMDGCYPKWRKMNTITKYNPFSNEIENKDVLNRYSSALYGYKGDLATAVAMNAAETEIAFNGFEEYEPDQLLGPAEMGPSNLTLFTSAPSSMANQLFSTYEVSAANANALVLSATENEISELQGKTVQVFGAPASAYDNKHKIIGRYQVASVSLSQKKITLASFPYTDMWKGKISMLDSYTILSDYSRAQQLKVVTSSALNPGYAHTGKNSLLLYGEVEAELYKLKVKADRKYVVSAWVRSLSDLDTISYGSDPAFKIRGIQLKFHDKSGGLLGVSDMIVPAGAIVEGWQRLDGTIALPANTSRIVLSMTSLLAQTLFDDIRIYPEQATMKTYVYDKNNYRVTAVLDDNNYASLYYYDEQGQLFLVKKETEQGIKTIQESYSHQTE